MSLSFPYLVTAKQGAEIRTVGRYATFKGANRAAYRAFQAGADRVSAEWSPEDDTHAIRLTLRVLGAVAWAFTPEEQAAIVRRSRNGSGTVYTFADGSRAFIPRGTAQVILRPSIAL